MIRILLILSLQFFTLSLIAQTDKVDALLKARKAIEMMDEGKIEESINLLEESQKLDPDNYVYPYEIDYAHILQK